MQILERRIDRAHRPYLIAEMSGNHNQSLDRALAIVDAAAHAGADAIKLQTYTADTMTLAIDHPDFRIEDPDSLWHGRSLHELYDEAHTPWAWHAPILERARKQGLACFSTPFDASAVDFLESLDIPAYKIASFECTDLALIRRVARTGKPLILSTGMATLAEIDATVRCAREAGAGPLVLLKCTSSYPASPVHSNVRTLEALRTAFGCEVGLSDHTLGCGAAIAAVALGATVIEKHFTLSRAEGGVDAAFSMEPTEFALLRAETERAWQALGEVQFGGNASEAGSRVFKRSLYVVEDLKAGETLSTRNLRAIRPGHGLPPACLDTLIGLRVARDVARGTPMHWSLLKPDAAHLPE